MKTSVREQDAMRNLVLNEEKLEAERKIISAKGEREAQIIISEGLTDEIIKKLKQLKHLNNYLILTIQKQSSPMEKHL